MANASVNRNRLYDGGASFYRGMNSYVDPEDLPSNQVAWLINSMVKSGNILTRPDYQVLLRLPDGRAQGMTIFTPTNGIPTIYAAVSGVIYNSQFPFTDYSVVPNIAFDPYVDQIVFKEAVKSVSNSVVIPPYSVLIMQDGVTRPAYTDGTISRHLSPGGSSNETPIGLWMEFVSGRLWVSRDREIFASDIFDPLLFTETTYVAGGQSLQCPDGDIVTALKRTADNKSLIAQTIKNTALILAGVTDRTQWANTPNFVSTLFPGVGNVSGKSFAENNGALWWMSVEGARNFTQVSSQLQTSGSATISQEMLRSYDNISPTLNRVCAFSFGTNVGFSVPSGDIFNRHTWIMDNAPADLIGSEYPPCWNGVWMGTRPVEWASAYINGQNRCFHLSQDQCGVRIWEAYAGNTGQDNGGRIFVSVELNGNKYKEEMSFKTYLYTEYLLANLFGEVAFSSEWRSDWGCWKPNADVNLCSQTCSETPECDPHDGTFQPTSRFIRTSVAVRECENDATDAPYGNNIGMFFQNRIRWYGKNGLKKFKSHAIQFEEPNIGACSVSDTTCKQFICCDQEVGYVSNVNDGGYYCASSDSNTECCSL